MPKADQQDSTQTSKPTHTQVYDLRYTIKRSVQTQGPQEDVILEMQTQPESYFIARTQEYIAHAVVDKVPRGQSKLALKDLPKCFLIAISKANIFSDPRTTYHIVVYPTDSQTNREVEQNVMQWHYFELERFSKLNPHVTLDGNFSNQEKWLHFLDRCTTYEQVPHDTPTAIEKAFKMMKIKKHDGNKAKASSNEIDYKEQLCKEAALGAIRQLKSLGESQKEILSYFRLFSEDDVEFVMDHLDNYPSCTPDELAKAFRKFNGYAWTTN